MLSCVLVIGGPPLASSAAESADESAVFGDLLKLLAERRRDHVTFTEVQQLAILDQPLHSSGELLYDAPDRLEKRTLEPRREDLVLEHGMLSVERDHHRRSVALRDLPQAVPFVESLRATLAGDRAALERYFTVRFSGTLGRWTLELTPSDATLKRSVQHIVITGETDRIRTVQIRQSDGDTSTLTIGAEVVP
ncbi:MAG TPA: LolA-related protein [Steroidobacteraceae bacterium]